MTTITEKRVYYTGKYTRPLSVLILGQKIPFDPTTQKSLLLSPESAVWLVANDPDCWTLDRPATESTPDELPPLEVKPLVDDSPRKKG